MGPPAGRREWGMSAKVALAIHHREVGTPRSDGLTVLLGHDAPDLRDVAEVVRDPRGEELAERDESEGGVLALERELRVGDPPSGERREILGACLLELIEELRERLPFALAELRVAI